MSSAWPAATAFGIALLLFGVIAGPAFVGGGMVFLAAGVAGWVGELRAEGRALPAETPAARAAETAGGGAGGHDHE